MLKVIYIKIELSNRYQMLMIKLDKYISNKYNYHVIVFVNYHLLWKEYLIPIPIGFNGQWGLAAELQKRCSKGALLFTFSAQKKCKNILYFVLVQILLSSCEAVIPSCSLQYREKPEI